MRPVDLEPIDLLEHVLIAFILSGVLWNVLVGYDLVAAAVFPPAVVVTTAVVTWALAYEARVPSTREL